MKAKKIIPSLGAVAFVALMAASPAQACMPFMPEGVGQPSCAAAQVQPPACPQPGPAAGQGSSCGLVNPELVAALGDMAAGAMDIATHMMRVLAQEVGRYAALGDAPR